jgi:hypothetical protein
VLGEDIRLWDIPVIFSSLGLLLNITCLGTAAEMPLILILEIEILSII